MSKYITSPLSRSPWWLALAAVAILTNSAIAWESSPGLNDLLLRSADDGLESPQSYAQPSGGVGVVGIDSDFFFAVKHLTYNRIDADGNLLFGDYGVRFATFQENADNELVLLPDGSGGAYCLVKFRDFGESNPRYRIYRVDENGVLQTASGGTLLTNSPDEQFDAEMIQDGQGGVIVVFEKFAGGQYDIVAQRMDSALNIDWLAGGITVCGATGDQTNPRLVSDGAGGALFAWTDGRNPDDDVFASRRLSGGSLIGTVDGVEIISGSADDYGPRLTTDGLGGAFVVFTRNDGDPDVRIAQIDPNMNVGFVRNVTLNDGMPQQVTDIVSDGAGGAFVIWSDTTTQFDPALFVQYLTPSGSPRWSEPGVRLSPVASSQGNGVLKPDGVGGVVAAWEDDRNAYSDVYAQRLDSSGARRWDDLGVPISIADDFQRDISVVDAGAGDLFVSFSDQRGTGGKFASIQRLDRNGYTGDPRPQITAVDDVPNDDGGVLLVQWTASDRDNDDEQLVDEYLVLRRFASAGAKPADADALALATGFRRDQAETLAAVGWEFVAAVEALRLPAYAYSAPSYADKTQSTTPVTEYIVIARAIDENALFESPPLGGTSIDNLAPGAPTNLQALRNGLDVDLSWAAPVQPTNDVGAYRVYRGSTPSFTVNGASFVGSSSELMWTESDPGTGQWFYRVTAVDTHDNEGPASDPAAAEALTAIGDRAASLATGIVRVQPNPFNPRTEVQFELARPGPVEIDVLDLRGRRVAQLFEGGMPGGAHTVRWSGVGDEGEALSSGIYFVRLVTESGLDVVKVALVK